jgi:alkylation response protein AidB-like acyl-CoA dehydrogenase
VSIANSSVSEMEDLLAFRSRSRDWLKHNLPVIDKSAPSAEISDEMRWARARKLQATLYQGGFAGLCYPREYGGQGLSPEHQRVFSEESRDYEMPLLLNLPTLAICLPTIFELGTQEQKSKHIDAVLRGEEVLVEFLSESHSGSDLAGARTRAEWNGSHWILNGSKIWTSSAYVGDYALCLARTDWNVPKHQGLTMFLVPVRHPGITVRRIRQVNGNSEFCEEFLDNVILEPEAVLGKVNGGWAVASHRFYYSRTALGGGNPYISGDHDLSVAVSRGIEVGGSQDLIALARQLWGASQSVPNAVVDACVAETVREQLAHRIIGAIKSESMPIEAAAMLRLFHAETDWRCVDAGLAVAASYAVTGEDAKNAGAAAFGEAYLFRQATSLGGGSTEMARNVISERVLRMPREAAGDLNVPFKDVRRSADPEHK